MWFGLQLQVILLQSALIHFILCFINTVISVNVTTIITIAFADWQHKSLNVITIFLKIQL